MPRARLGQQGDSRPVFTLSEFPDTQPLERSPNVNGPWTTNATFTAAVTGPIEFRDTNAPPGQAFYRVAQQ